MSKPEGGSSEKSRSRKTVEQEGTVDESASREKNTGRKRTGKSTESGEKKRAKGKLGVVDVSMSGKPVRRKK